VDASVLVDTNVLIYGHDSDEHLKHARARSLLAHSRIANAGLYRRRCSASCTRYPRAGLGAA